MDPITITVMYTCNVCGLHDVKLAVPARLDPDAEDVKTWMEKTIALIGADHFRRSPRCNVRRLTNMKLPIPDNGPNTWVGAPPLQ